MFICYAASAIGFEYCPPVLGLDGTHLKMKYKGVLLTTTAVDANGSLFPIATVVVDIENDDNWLWFIQLFHGVLVQHVPTLLIPRALAFISDHQKGLLEGVECVFPGTAHGRCLRHLYENMYKQFKHPKLKTFLWQAAEAITKDDFNKALSKIEGIDKNALQWLLTSTNPEHWAELYFPGRRYGHITSNIAESLNSALLEACEKPILGMFEHMRQHLMSWFAERWGIDSVVPPNQIVVSKVTKKIQELIVGQARCYCFLSATNVDFEVLSLRTNDCYIVKLPQMTCTCFAWQSTGIPCSHATGIILFHKENPQTYVQAFLSFDAYRRTYANAIYPPAANVADNTPIFGPLQYSDNRNAQADRADRIIPPHARRAAGRPKVRRIRGGVEGPFGQRRAKRCGCCNGIGHSNTTCDASI